MKKIISFLSALVMVASMGAMTASAESNVYAKTESTSDGYNVRGDLLKYDLDNNPLLAGVITNNETTVEGDIDNDGDVDEKDAAIYSEVYVVWLSLGPSIESDQYDGWLKKYGMSKEKFDSLLLKPDPDIDVSPDLFNKLCNCQSLRIITYLAAKKVDPSVEMKDFRKISEIVDTHEEIKGVSEAYVKCMKDINNERVNLNNLFKIADINMGDSNLDGNVDAKDGTNVLQSYASGLVNGSTFDNTDLSDFDSDVDFDGSITSKDATIILQRYAEGLTK
jgi:hypothetical protein